NNKAVKVRSHVQRTSYKVSEKLIIIQEAKQIGVLAASYHFGIDQSMLNELRQMGIAVTSGSIKMQMYTILSTTCANKYPGASQQFHASKSCQKLPKDLTEKIIEFHKFVIQAQLKCAKTVQIRTTGNKKNQFTCVLAITTNDQENSEINDNKNLFEVVEEDSLSAEELED
ncbi:6674_t:CDS:2, partial [Cetraspora pellucida]